MKMILTILNDEDSGCVFDALQEENYTVTRIDSTGGFLRLGSTTLMIGTEDDRVDQAIQLINAQCAPSVEPIARRATVFVLNVEHFEQI